MPQCPTCGRALDGAARFCPNDGTTIRPDTAPPELFPRGVLAPPPPPSPSQGTREKVDVLVGAVLDGRYRIEKRLGQGGVGAVYASEHVETRRPVAVKVLHAVFAGSDEFHKRFEREARAASKLTHPTCVSVLDYGRVDRVEPISAGAQLLGTPYLVMEYVRGVPLSERVGKAMPAAEAVVIARGVLSALKHAHGLGIVHRDVKPANIMLVEDAGTGLVVKLLDFGLAKMTGDLDGDGDGPLTQAGMVFGTPGYLSPEQASGGAADARSDLYALGIVLYELVAGRRPFLRSDPLDVVRDHLNTLPPPPRSFGAQISTELEQAILRALAKEPRGRFQTAEEFSTALAALPDLRPPPEPAAPAPIAVSPSTTTVLPRPFKLDRRMLIAGGSLLTLIVLVLVIVLARKHPAAAPIVAPAPPPTVASPSFASESAHRHLAQAIAYQRKLWCSDALEELDRALRDDPSLRADREVSRIAISCLTPKTRDKAIHFLVDKVGMTAKSALTEAAQGDPNVEIRRGAERALEKLR